MNVKRDVDFVKKCPYKGTADCEVYPKECPFPNIFDAFQRCRTFRSHILSNPHYYVPFLVLFLSKVTGREIDVSYGPVARYMYSLVFTTKTSDGKTYSFGDTHSKATIRKYTTVLYDLLQALLPPEF
jgi:hypothetical protein